MDAECDNESSGGCILEIPELWGANQRTGCFDEWADKKRAINLKRRARRGGGHGRKIEEVTVVTGKDKTRKLVHRRLATKIIPPLGGEELSKAEKPKYSGPGPKPCQKENSP